MDVNKIIEHREWLHQNAELSFCEYKTAEYICKVLTELGIEHKIVAKTGVMATIGSSKKAIVLRADIDALPITENSNVTYSSCNSGVMHACGHDMHTASLLGALSKLKENPPHNTTIIGLFQPGEEVAPGGAIKVINEGVLDNYDIKAVIGIHSSPELFSGEIGIREGEFMASTDEIHLTIIGKGGHAARPQNHRNPVWAAVELLSELHKITPKDKIDHLLAFGKIEALGATNVIPDRVKIEGTFRTFSREWREECKEMIKNISKTIAAKHNLEIEVVASGGYPSVINDIELTRSARTILCEEFGTENVIDIPKRLTAEDFGRYGALYPSLFLRFGVTKRGEKATELHTAGFVADNLSLTYSAKIYELLGRKL